MSRTTIAHPTQVDCLRTRFGALGIRKLALHLPDTIAASDGSVQCLIGYETGEGEPGRSHPEGPAHGCVHRGRRVTATT
jgi:hypothetical protein